MRFLILFIFLTTNVFANDVSEIKNIVIHKDLKVYDNVIFLDKNDKKINIKEFNGSLLLLNFWATWCEPCKEEMPSLDRLQINENLSNLKIFAINISQESKKKVDSFFKDLNIKNFDSYFDSPTTLAKVFSLRGVLDAPFLKGGLSSGKTLVPCGKIINGRAESLIFFEISSKNPKLSLVTLFLLIDIDPIFFRYQPKIGINNNSFFKMKTGELKIV